MANNYKSVENEFKRNFEKLLNEMSSEEFKEYFKKLIENYYKVLFTFEEDYSKYYEDSERQYKTIQIVKDLTGFNNIDNFENLERLKQAEEIAFNQMNELHFMENNYSNIIYSTASQELVFINDSLANLVELYNNNPSEELASVIGSTLLGTVEIFKRNNKLPVHDNFIDFKKDVTFKKEHFKENAKIKPEEDIEFSVFTIPVLSCYLPKLYEWFNSILKDIEKIVPESVEEFNSKVEASEELEFLKLMLEVKPEGYTEEDVYNIVAYTSYAQQQNRKGYLYELIEEWS